MLTTLAPDKTSGIVSITSTLMGKTYVNEEYWVVAPPEAIELAYELMDDFLSPKKFYEGYRKLKELLKPNSELDLAVADSWSTRDLDDGRQVVTFGTFRPEAVTRSKLRTGHMYFGSYMEAAEDAGYCGTCNAARCDTCREVYRDSEGKLHEWEAGA